MAPTSPSEQSEQVPCPGCGSTQGFHRVGKFRAQCTNCNSTFPNAEVNLTDQDPQ